MACEPAAVTEQELKNYVTNEENGLVKQETRAGIDITAYYRPADLVIAQKLYGETYDSKIVDSLRKEHEGLLFFVLHLSRDKREIETYFAADPTQYNAVTNYFNGLINEDLFVLSDGDTLKPAQTMYTPGLGTAGHTSVMVVFEADKSKLADDLVLCWEDLQLKTGLHEIVFSKKDITHHPKIKF